MPDPERDRLATEILRTIPMPNIIAAAAFMMRQDATKKAGLDDDDAGRAVINLKPEDVPAFVESLNVQQLEELRQVALRLEGGMEH
jgi:hypothetical protein